MFSSLCGSAGMSCQPFGVHLRSTASPKTASRANYTASLPILHSLCKSAYFGSTSGMLFSPDRAISSEVISEYLGLIQGIVLGTNGGECCCTASAKIADGKKDGCTASVMGCGIAAGCTASVMGCGIAAGCTTSIMGRGIAAGCTASIMGCGIVAGCTASIMGCGIAAGCTALAILGGPGGIAAGCSSQNEPSNGIVSL